MRVTEWYPISVDPVRIGVYQREFLHGLVGYAWFDGEDWGTYCESADEANRWRTKLKSAMKYRWRGLTEKAK
jgi:hypothetical protein